MLTIALPKGTPVEPLIRDSRAFALCQIGADDVFLQRKFAAMPDRNDDPFAEATASLFGMTEKEFFDSFDLPRSATPRSDRPPSRSACPFRW